MRYERDLGEYLDERGHGVQGADRDRDLLGPAQRQCVDDGVQVGLVIVVEHRVQVECVESRGRQAAVAREPVGEAGCGGIALQHRDVSEQGHRVEVLDPVVLDTDEPGRPGGRLPHGHVTRGDGGTGCRQVEQQPVVVPSFLDGVPVQVVRERPGERVGGLERMTAPCGQFHQGYRGSDHLVHRAEIAYISVGEAVGPPDLRHGGVQRRLHEIELDPQGGAASDCPAHAPPKPAATCSA